MLAVLLALGACGGDKDTDTATDSEAETETEVATDTTTDTETETETETETDTEAETETEVESDTETETETEEDTETDTSVSTETDTNTDTEAEEEPEPEEELGPEPTDSDLTIVDADGKSEYVIVYERRNERLKEYANSLKDHIKSKYGVTLPVYEYGAVPSTSDKRIVIGNADANAGFAKAKIGKSNDFIIDVCDNDLILYPANEYLYGYLIDVAKADIFNGEVNKPFVISADTTYKLSESENKDINYVEYLKAKDGEFKYETVVNIFLSGTYNVGQTTIPYRIYVPSSYDSTKEYPLVTVLHGAGERGNDNKSQLKNMISEMFNQENSPYADAIVFCPQCPGGQQWVDTPWKDGNYSIDKVPESDDLMAVMDIINNIIATSLSTDTDRYYVMGLSMGGFGAWDLIMRHTDTFAGAVCLCGGADPSQAEALLNMPIWAIHSSNDGDVPYAGTQEMCQAIIDAGGELCKFDTTSTAHNVWADAGKSTDISKWLFEQKKPEMVEEVNP